MKKRPDIDLPLLRARIRVKFKERLKAGTMFADTEHRNMPSKSSFSLPTHTRINHSLGVARLSQALMTVSEVILKYEESGEITEATSKMLRNLLLSVYLHDVGHMTYENLVEKITNRLGEVLSRAS